MSQQDPQNPRRKNQSLLRNWERVPMTEVRDAQLAQPEHETSHNHNHNNNHQPIPLQSPATASHHTAVLSRRQSNPFQSSLRHSRRQSSPLPAAAGLFHCSPKVNHNVCTAVAPAACCPHCWSHQACSQVAMQNGGSRSDGNVLRH